MVGPGLAPGVALGEATGLGEGEGGTGDEHAVAISAAITMTDRSADGRDGRTVLFNSLPCPRCLASPVAVAIRLQPRRD